MEIIKHGNRHKTSCHLKCNNCGCEFIADENDIRRCPECGAYEYVEELESDDDDEELCTVRNFNFPKSFHNWSNGKETTEAWINSTIKNTITKLSNTSNTYQFTECGDTHLAVYEMLDDYDILYYYVVVATKHGYYSAEIYR